MHACKGFFVFFFWDTKAIAELGPESSNNSTHPFMNEPGLTGMHACKGLENEFGVLIDMGIGCWIGG